MSDEQPVSAPAVRSERYQGEFEDDERHGHGTCVFADGGKYTLRVTATDSEGEEVDHVTFIEGVVTAIEQVDGETYATIGGTRALWQTISSIGLAPTTDDAADTTATNDDGDDETTPKAA